MGDETTAKAPTTAKSLWGTVSGFLNHHIADLNAVGTALQGLLAALPVNAETRASINQAITRVTESADNIASSLQNMGALERPEFHIAESDLVKALDDSDMKAIVSQMIADYLRDHPPVGAVPAQQDAAAATAAQMGDDMQAGDRSGQQQAGQGGETRTALEPQPGTAKAEEAPAPSTATDAEKGAAGTLGNGE